MSHVIAPMQPPDWRSVRRIYAEGLATGLAAFMKTPPIWRDWNAGHLPIGRFIAHEKSTSGQIIGWAALSPVPDT
ncbi:MAG: hypothetical protein AAF346_22995 [Pseudomonadota bacterium]